MPQNTIYHYTGLDALKNIVESGKMRASHYRDFDDNNELRLGTHLLLAAVKQHSVEARDREYRDFLVEGIETFAKGRLAVYVVSLTEMRDSAHHWCKYARRGVAIGFCRERIQEGFPIDISHRFPDAEGENPVRPDPANRFMQCRYVTHFDLPELVSTRFFAADSYPAAFRNSHVRASGVIYACLSVSIYQTICAIKAPGFYEDAEWRCVHINPDVEEYPVKTAGNREFVEMQFTPVDFIREVWIGPHDQTQECEHTIHILRRRGLLRCPQMVSSLPRDFA